MGRGSRGQDRGGLGGLLLPLLGAYVVPCGCPAFAPESSEVELCVCVCVHLVVYVFSQLHMHTVIFSSL